ncbi:MAG: hypothetical protein IJS28_07480 [Synergistaceae bacterium]|nr:hypothetical protein [Synergistaceae bacterium]
MAINEGIMQFTRAIQYKRGISSDLEDLLYIPTEGEIIIATDTGDIRAGDGVHMWKDLPSYDGTEIANNLNTATAGKALDASQGKLLNDRVEVLEAVGGIDCGALVRARSNITCTQNYDGSASQTANFNAGFGFGHISKTYLSYEQILSDLELNASSEAAAVTQKFTAAFSLTNGTNTYTYGTDFNIIQGSDTDSTTNEHTVQVQWISGGEHPAGDYDIIYSGRAA